MGMPVVRIRVMRMAMGHRSVRVFVRMGLLAVPWKIMLMLMMQIMAMSVRVSERFMCVLVLVPLGQMQPDATRHQCSGDPEHERRRFM